MGYPLCIRNTKLTLYLSHPQSRKVPKPSNIGEELGVGSRCLRCLLACMDIRRLCGL